MGQPGHDRSRLVKALLPASVVRAMDEFVDRSSAYADRSEFISDAIQGHLAELRAGPAEASPLPRSEPKDVDASSSGETRTVISAPDSETPTLPPVAETQTEPTWGMHNRDFPTLWAANDLARETRRRGGPIAFRAWVDDLIRRAWEIPRTLGRDQYDTSGFPTNAAKPEASAGRFVRFFVGTAAGEGPLFSLGLASHRDGEVALSPAGAELLTSIAGLSCARDTLIQPSWTIRFLCHLAVWAPADLDFLAEVLRHIDEGQRSRPELVKSVAQTHTGWSDSVCGTNVAGYVARAREWELLSPKQTDGRYVLRPRAMELIATAVESR